MVDEKYDIDKDKKFVKITCINPTCKKTWYLQVVNKVLSVECFTCGSKWINR